MEKEEKTIHYLAGKMSEGEVSEYLIALQNDDELKDIHNFHTQLQKDLQTQKGLEKLKDFHQKKVDDKSFLTNNGTLKISYERPKKVLPYLSIAASVAILLIAGWFVIPKILNNNESVFVEVLEEIPPAYTKMQSRDNNLGMTGKNEAEEELNKAYQFFENSNYNNAISLLEEYLLIHTEDYEAIFILALSYLQINQLEKAEDLLITLEKQTLFSARNDVLLKLAALFLKEKNNMNEACTLLQEVLSEGNKKQQNQAQELLNYCQ